VVNDVENVSSNNENQYEKLIRLLEDQLTHMNQQNQELSKKLDQSLKQNETLTQQLQHLTKLLYGFKTEKSKYNAPDGQVSLFEDDSSFTDSEHTEEQSQQTISYTVVRKIQKKKRNDSLCEHIEVEVIHHHPESTICDCCQHLMVEMGGTLAREEAKFIPAKMMKVQHIEHAYECKNCKGDASRLAQIKRGKAPQPAIQRSIASPSVLAKVIYDKFAHYLPLYRQVNEWARYGLDTNDKNLSNWVIRVAHDWLLPIYLFQSSLSRARSVLESFTEGYTGTIICDGYSAYNKIGGIIG
jgi:transposase